MKDTTTNNGEHKENDLAVQIKLLVEVGEFEKARELASDVTPDWKRLDALRELAKQLVLHGEPDMAPGIATEVTASKIEPDWKRFSVALDIAVQTVRAGYYWEAIQIVDTMNEKKRDEALRALVTALVGGGDHERARETSIKISNPEVRTGALKDLARESGSATDYARLREAIQSISNEETRVSALRGMAVQAAETGLVDVAMAAALDIEDIGRQNEALVALATRSLGEKTHAVTHRFASCLVDAGKKVEILRQLAVALSKEGRHDDARQIFDEAEQAARRIDDQEQQAEALHMLAAALLETGQTEFRHLRPISKGVKSFDPGTRFVAVIGINDYVHCPKLKNAVGDARGLQELLVNKLGFFPAAPSLYDTAATKEGISCFVDDNLRKILRPEDALVLFFAGHGDTRVDTVGGRTIETGYVVPVEARPKHWGDFIELEAFLSAISKLPSRHILVILDACHSGFALGGAVQRLRSMPESEEAKLQDLASRVSRKVITSAQHDQPALDNGPVADHSLFTGMLIDGLNWGRADLTGDGLVTSSELGLFLQQEVTSSSHNEQTPDFGSFYLDDRGELIISLRSGSFETIKARAYNALQEGRLADLRDMVEQLESLRPQSPEVFYLQYRLSLLDRNTGRAKEMVDRLRRLNLSKGTIPLTEHDLMELSIRLHFWQHLFSLGDEAVPVDVTVFAGKSKDRVSPLSVQTLGDFPGYQLDRESVLQLRVTNPTRTPKHVYMVMIDPDGRLDFPTLWQDDEVVFLGLQPTRSYLSYPFAQVGKSGIYEWRLFCSSTRIHWLFNRPSVQTRGVLEPVTEADIAGVSTTTILYRVIEWTVHR